MSAAAAAARLGVQRRRRNIQQRRWMREKREKQKGGGRSAAAVATAKPELHRREAAARRPQGVAGEVVTAGVRKPRENDRIITSRERIWVTHEYRRRWSIYGRWRGWGNANEWGSVGKCEFDVIAGERESVWACNLRRGDSSMFRVQCHWRKKYLGYSLFASHVPPDPTQIVHWHHLRHTYLGVRRR